MPCDGNSQKTCCRIKGEDCRYLIDDGSTGNVITGTGFL